MDKKEAKCLNCKYARRAENKEYVGCSKIYQATYNKMILDNEDYIFAFYKKKEIALGWVSLNSRPEDTNRSGLLTNGIVCFKKDDICEHWEAMNED